MVDVAKSRNLVVERDEVHILSKTSILFRVETLTTFLNFAPLF